MPEPDLLFCISESSVNVGRKDLLSHDISYLDTKVSFAPFSQECEVRGWTYPVLVYGSRATWCCPVVSFPFLLLVLFPSSIVVFKGLFPWRGGIQGFLYCEGGVRGRGSCVFLIKCSALDHETNSQSIQILSLLGSEKCEIDSVF